MELYDLSWTTNEFFYDLLNTKYPLLISDTLCLKDGRIEYLGNNNDSRVEHQFFTSSISETIKNDIRLNVMLGLSISMKIVWKDFGSLSIYCIQNIFKAYNAKVVSLRDPDREHYLIDVTNQSVFPNIIEISIHTTLGPYMMKGG